MVKDLEPKRAKGSGVKVVYETIRDEILSLVLRPGALLDEMTIAERFQMSRSPVREALIRLAGDDLVHALANRSAVVAPIDIQSFPKYVEALDIAQRMNTRLAAELRSESDLVEMLKCQKIFVAAVKTGDYLAMSEANKVFHMSIAKAGRNAYLAAFYDRLLNQGRRMLHLHFEFLENNDDAVLLTDEHDEMLDAIKAKDVERADILAHQHTRQFQDTFVEYLRHNYLNGVPIRPPVLTVKT
jgi:DNA-binding GntR family transcriptional regulator